MEKGIEKGEKKWRGKGNGERREENAKGKGRREMEKGESGEKGKGEKKGRREKRREKKKGYGEGKGKREMEGKRRREKDKGKGEQFNRGYVYVPFVVWRMNPACVDYGRPRCTPLSPYSTQIRFQVLVPRNLVSSSGGADLSDEWE